MLLPDEFPDPHDGYTDEQIVEVVREAGSDSPECRLLREALRESGLGRLRKMGARTVFEQLRKYGISLQPPPKSFRDEFPTICVLAVNQALDTFMERAVFKDGWKPAEGASLRTYFGRAVQYAFASQYRKYCREEHHSEEVSYGDTQSLVARLPDRSSPDPEEVAIDADLIRRIVPGTTRREITMIWMSAEGFTHAEIGKEVGMTPEAVSSALRRFRGRACKLLLNIFGTLRARRIPTAERDDGWAHRRQLLWAHPFSALLASASV